ncbi:MAG: rod shape-determining protein RodA, partial [Candidatus Portiera sp.]|nr:rod shape-determining protein RodA [Portiera sp.]
TRWIDLGPVNFQPSEYMKIVLPLTICSVLTYKPLPISLHQLIAIIGLVFLPVFLVFLQPDLGTALIIVFSSGCLVFLAGINLRAALSMLLIILASLPLAWFYVLHDYHKSRILTFINPESDPLNTGWSIIQSKIAVGTGSIFGKGWGNSHQAKYEFLPETHTDFIFSVYAEEFGFFGVLVLLGIYLLIITRGFSIALAARDSFEKLFCGVLIFIFSSYIIINIGMVTGVLPVVGVPLPMISYGGTALITTMGAFGMLMSVAAHSRKVI